MNRETKFRAKRTDNGEWVYGYYVKTPITAEFQCDGQFLDSGKGRHCIVQDFVAHEIDPKTVGQYTGYRDKNFKEMYEGDITLEECEDNKFIRKVAWYEDRFVFENIKKSTMRPGISTQYTEVKVIGNIYENPELLK